jgi:hypothetical protein
MSSAVYTYSAYRSSVSKVDWALPVIPGIVSKPSEIALSRMTKAIVISKGEL